MPTEKQRREAERRRLRRQLERRAQRDARRRRFALVASVIGTLVVIAIVVTVVVFTGHDKSTPPAAGSTRTGSPTASSPSPTTPLAAYPCTWTPSGTAAKPATPPPTTRPPRSGKVDVLVQTSLGPMTFQLNRAEAPCAVESFQSLAEQQYFNGTSCHRLTSGTLSVLQCGDPTGTGSGGPGYSFADELSGKEKYTRGVLAMANSGPNTNGSQFFIVYKNSTLQPNYTIFGKVTSGMGVVDKVAAKGSTPTGDGKPKLPITLRSVGVVQ
jgi:peptidyl-prolyl cis-trans isomerase B (cyclophilin B)